MRLPDWIKRLVHRNGTRSPKEALQDLDAIITRNELGLQSLRGEIEKTDTKLAVEETNIRDKRVEGWRKRFVLQTIRRLRTHLTNLDRRMGIYDKNLTIALALVGKVEDMAAMSMRGVETEQIDQVILDFEEQMAEYLNVVGVSIEPMDPVEEERELDKLEKEILGVKEEKSKETISEPAVVPVAPVVEQPTVVRAAAKKMPKSSHDWDDFNDDDHYEGPMFE